MKPKRMTKWGAGILAIVPCCVAYSQPPVDAPKIARITPGPSAPVVTILSSGSGALLRTMAAGSASLNLGTVSYFTGASAPGQSNRKRAASLVISTRFSLRVDCPGDSSSARVSVTVSRLDDTASHSIAIDGITLGSMTQILTQIMPCGSAAEHRLDVEVPMSTAAGAIGSTVAFVASRNP